MRPCSGCGLDELFDPPSVLAAATSDNLEDMEVLEAFTTRCGLCGGTQIVALREAVGEEDWR